MYARINHSQEPWNRAEWQRFKRRWENHLLFSRSLLNWLLMRVTQPAFMLNRNLVPQWEACNSSLLCPHQTVTGTFRMEKNLSKPAVNDLPPANVEVLDTVQSCMWVPVYRRMLLSCRWRLYLVPKRINPPTLLHGAITDSTTACLQQQCVNSNL